MRECDDIVLDRDPSPVRLGSRGEGRKDPSLVQCGGGGKSRDPSLFQLGGKKQRGRGGGSRHPRQKLWQWCLKAPWCWSRIQKDPREKQQP